MPKISTRDFFDNTKSDQAVKNYLKSVVRILYHPLLSSVIHTKVSFLRLLGCIGRPTFVE